MAKSKWYAIRTRDKETVNKIIDNWSDCEKYVKGHSVVYKGFTTLEDALEYLGCYKEEEKIEDLVDTSKDLLYVDGSYLNDMIGWGWVHVRDNKVIAKNCGGIIPTRGITGRNIVGELKATQNACTYAIANGLKEVTIVNDYQGISSFVDGSWKPKERVSVDYKAFMESKILPRLKVNFCKVKGHTGQEYNDVADELAKLGTTF